MDTIAVQARASKETLYKWFGDLEGLLKRLIERNADSAANLQGNDRVREAYLGI